MNTTKYLVSLVIWFVTLPIMAQQTNPELVVQANLDAYNAQDLEGFMSYFSENVTMYNFNDGAQTANGIAAVRAIYEPYFEASPNLHSKILKRTVFDNKVLDYEYITGARGSKEPFEIVLIYEVENDKITKMTAIHKR
jgi:hypothetical protein